MNPVIQQEVTGCGIASAAAIAGISYSSAKLLANDMGIFADDPSLWSNTTPIRRLLKKMGMNPGPQEMPFTTWQALPELALLAIKWHLDNDTPFWHWVVFVRDDKGSYVLDSKKSLKHNRRTDFGRMHPKWYITVKR